MEPGRQVLEQVEGDHGAEAMGNDGDFRRLPVVGGQGVDLGAEGLLDALVEGIVAEVAKGGSLRFVEVGSHDFAGGAGIGIGAFGAGNVVDVAGELEVGGGGKR